MIAPNRKKIIEAIVYFSKKLKNPNKTMMFKVLAELDYKHFLQTGMPVTNLEYFAWDKGPVAKDFYFEITDGDTIDLPDDFKKALSVEKTYWINDKGEQKYTFTYKPKPKRKPNLEVFSPRQKDILEEVAFIYKTTTAKDASLASHEPNTPWERTVKMDGKEGTLIDFLKIVPDNVGIDKEEVRERMVELSAFIANYGH